MNHVALHEAAHVASFLTDGLPILCARVDHPRRGVAGEVLLDWDRFSYSRKAVSDFLVGLLVPAALEGRLGPGFPIAFDDMGTCRSDGASGTKVALEVLGLDTVDWHGAAWNAESRLRDARFQDAVLAIARAFEQKAVLSEPELLKLRSDAIVKRALAELAVAEGYGFS